MNIIFLGEKMKEDILRQIGTIARALDSIANIEFKEMQLNRGQYLYLVRIKENPGIISDHLAGMLSVDRTTTARSVKKLEQNGLIKKESDQQNKKIKHLFVTDKGQELAKKIEKENIYSNEQVLKGLDKKQRRELANLLKQVEDNASASWHFVKNGGKRKY
ncbi:MarR family transcriptional regulator [Lactobacillus kefiranofaciens subsp. kefiranofaciens DSM 5016 = JCM 6985]|nr:MarR family transcriptional regulator [Lactobacillus kefiranofaciens subsp. kefirgranum DSM 10550 = JCM 8572]KRM22021.1 MarR family transcriptional regulator [Lactobacillus kefiranofaciens subsp. kefiranofaciens DSM 5016 = JCM 6985]